MVRLEGDRVLLRIHLVSVDARRGRPLYETLVERARRMGLAGATVLRGIAGYVEGGPMLEHHGPAMNDPRPVVVEIVEDEILTERFLDAVAPLLAGRGALVTTERARVVRYRTGDGPKRGRP